MDAFFEALLTHVVEPVSEVATCLIESRGALGRRLEELAQQIHRASELAAKIAALETELLDDREKPEASQDSTVGECARKLLGAETKLTADIDMLQMLRADRTRLQLELHLITAEAAISPSVHSLKLAIAQNRAYRSRLVTSKAELEARMHVMRTAASSAPGVPNLGTTGSSRKAQPHTAQPNSERPQQGPPARKARIHAPQQGLGAPSSSQQQQQQSDFFAPLQRGASDAPKSVAAHAAPRAVGGGMGGPLSPFGC